MIPRKWILSLLTFASSLAGSCAQQPPELTLMPSGEKQVHSVGSSLVVTCLATVERPHLVTDIRWVGPKGEEILEDNRIYTELVGNDLALFIKHLSEKDSGNYKCTAKYAMTQSLQVGFHLSTITKITWDNAPERQHAIINQDFKVKCVVIANPPAVIDWLKDKQLVLSGLSSAAGSTTPDTTVVLDVSYRDTSVAAAAHVTAADTAVVLTTSATASIVLQSWAQLQETWSPASLTPASTASPSRSTSSAPDTLDDHLIIESDGLLIRKVSNADGGTYTCRARVQETGELAEREIAVEVLIPPEIEIQDESVIEGVETEEVKLMCRAHGHPIPTYRWINDKQAEVSTYDRFILDENTGTLTILDTQRQDAGTYTCIAENEAGRDDMQLDLMVILKPKVTEFLNITVQVEKEPKLVCKATGEPKPDIIFKKLSSGTQFISGGQPEDDRIYMSQRVEGDEQIGELVISNVRRSDDGLYSCMAQNKGGESYKTGHITVEFPPSFTSTPMFEEWSWIDNPVNLTCIADSIPNATITWEWQGRLLGEDWEDSQLVQIGSGPVSTLKVTPIDGNYFSRYTCKASNVLGSDEHVITLKEARPPSNILQVTFETITATTITFKFIGPIENGGQDIVAYAVQYKEDHQSWDEARQQVWPVDVPYILEWLEPLKAYQLRFAARNKVGFGNWAAEQTITMPKRSAPEEPDIISQSSAGGIVQVPYPHKYQLHWRIPPNNGEPIDIFEITYFPVLNTSKGWMKEGELTLIKVENSGTVTEEITGLTPLTYFKIELRAHNIIGYSSPGEIIIRTARDPNTSSPVQPGVEGNSVTAKDDSLSAGVVVGIIIAILFILLVIVDISCYFVNKTGVLKFICVKACGEVPPGNDVEENSKESDKAPFKDSNNDTINDDGRLMKDATESTPMIHGDDEKELLKEKQKEPNDVDVAVKKSESKSSITKDSAV